jgi:3-oxoadipate enol-lactonase
VIRYDARGFGRSPAPTVKFTLLTDLIAVLDHYGLDRVAIVGCSQGGGSELALALEQPARVSAMVLLCPGIPGFAWPDEPDELEAEYNQAMEAGDVDAIARLIQGIWGAAGSTEAVMEQFRSAARAYLSSGDLMQEDPPVLDRLGEIAVPTSLLVGDLDYPPLIESNRQAAARIPGCQLTVVPAWTTSRPSATPTSS